MIELRPGLFAVFAVPLILVLLRERKIAMRGVAIAACSLPFLLPPTAPFARGAAALLTWLFLVKTLQYTAGHERPVGLTDLLQFLLIPVVVRWDSPRRTDGRRAARTLLTALMQLGLAFLIMLAVLQIDSHHPVQLITTQFGIYLTLAGTCNLAALSLCVRGVDYDDPFDNPLMARTPREFWGRRWNTWVNHMLYRYVFIPSGGWRRPARGTLAAFAVSAALHEGFTDVGTRSFSGWMGAFFLVQGLLVIATSKSRWFRRMARQQPAIARALTLILMIATGVMLVRGADGIDPSDAWARCCKS